MIKYEVLVIGELQTNCYLVWNETSKEAVIIDAADDGVMISEEIEKRGLNLKYILATHGHFDHNLGVLDLKLIYNIPYCVSKKDWFLLERQQETAKHFLKMEIKVPNLKKIEVDLDKEKEIKFGDEFLEIIRTPGHTPGSVCFYNKKNVVLFSGDTLFKDCRGRTDFKYGSTENIFKSLKKLMKLPIDTLVLPGHGDETTIDREKLKYSLKN
jgi:glyoxylase-like metal-dependent hydrolase (beta-lactamase superfamily II)